MIIIKYCIYFILVLSFVFYYQNKDKPKYYLLDNYDEIFIFLENDKKIYGIKEPSLSEDLVIDVFCYLTINNAMLEVGYYNHMIYSTVLKSYQIDDGRLILNVSDDFNRCKNKYLLYRQLYFSYLFLGCDSLVIKTSNDEYIIDDLVVNYHSGKGENLYTIFYFLDNSLIYPLSYYTDLDYQEFLVSKLSDISFDISYKTNELEIINDEIVIVNSEERELLEQTIYYTIYMSQLLKV